MRRLLAVAITTMFLVGAACSSESGGYSSNSGSDPDDYSVAYKLAVVGGDAGDEAEFQEAIDCIMASGIKGAETETKVGDTLVASWQASSQEDSLLEWAQAFCYG